MLKLQSIRNYKLALRAGIYEYEIVIRPGDLQLSALVKQLEGLPRLYTRTIAYDNVPTELSVLYKPEEKQQVLSDILKLDASKRFKTHLSTLVEVDRV